MYIGLNLKFLFQNVTIFKKSTKNPKVFFKVAVIQIIRYNRLYFITDKRMAEFSKYSMYGLGYQGAGMSTKDKVDKMVDEIIDLHMYNEVQDFIKRNFGDVEGSEWFKYPELNKSVYVKNEEDKIEVYMLKGEKQYYAKGWKPVV